MQLPQQLPSKRTMLLAAGTAVVSYNVYRFGRFLYNILTYVDQSSKVQHNCITPSDFKHQGITQESTMQLVRAQYPELVDLVEKGHIIALQPANMLQQLLGEQQQQRGSADVSDHEGMHLSQDDVRELVSSPILQACLMQPAPALMFVVGTVHVSKQSGEDVKKVIKVLSPGAVVMELCAPRINGLLIDPYADPLHDLEPCPQRLAAAAALKHKTLPEILAAAIASRDHNVLQTILTGLYAKMEDQLEVRAGVEFIAARTALIEQLQDEQQSKQQQQAQQQYTEQHSTNVDGQQQSQQHELSQQRQQCANGSHCLHQHHWVQMCVPGDRPVRDTLLGLWGSLGPWRRLRFILDIALGLFGKIDEETIASLANEDMVEVLLKEFSDSYPEVMRPLLHDRNWVLATNLWLVAQKTKGTPGPVLAIVGKGHLTGMVYVVKHMTEFMARTGGRPIRIETADNRF